MRTWQYSIPLARGAYIGTTFQGIDLWEWGNMADVEKSYAKFDADPTLVKFVTEFWTYVVPGTHREEIWKPVLKLK